MTAQGKIVGVRELRGTPSDLPRRAGESFDIVSRGRKLAELRAPVDERPGWPSADPASPNFRKPGALKGGMRIADDLMLRCRIGCG